MAFVVEVQGEPLARVSESGRKRTLRGGGGQPAGLAPLVLMWTSTAYIVAFLLAAFAVYRRRDL